MVKSARNNELTAKQLAREKKKRQRNLRLVFFLICLLMFVAGLNSGFAYIMGMIADVVKVEAVGWEMAVPGQLWLFQEEAVVSSEQRGVLEPIVQAGQRVSKGATVARLRFFDGTALASEANVSFTSPIAGIVSYEVDGLEMVDSKEQFDQLSIDRIERAMEIIKINEESNPAGKEEVKAAGAGQVAAGDIVFKITDNLSDCYLYFKTEEPAEDWFEADKNILLQAEDGSKGYAVMKEYKKLDVGSSLLLKLSSGLEKQRLNRQVPVKIIIEKENKAAVPLSAVVTKEEGKGVFIFKNGYVHWNPVTIIEERADQVIVEGIEPDEWVVLRPYFVRDGMRLKFR